MTGDGVTLYLLFPDCEVIAHFYEKVQVAKIRKRCDQKKIPTSKIEVGKN